MNTSLLFTTALILTYCSCGLVSSRKSFSTTTEVQNKSVYEISANAELSEGSFEDACETKHKIVNQKIPAGASATIVSSMNCHYQPRVRSNLTVLAPESDLPNIWIAYLEMGLIDFKTKPTENAKWTVELDGRKENIFASSINPIKNPGKHDSETQLPFSIAIPKIQKSEWGTANQHSLFTPESAYSGYQIVLTNTATSVRFGVPKDQLLCKYSAASDEECFKDRVDQDNMVWFQLKPTRHGTSLLSISTQKPARMICDSENCKVESL